MAGPIRISILANASQAKREITGVGKEAETGVSRAKKALVGLATGFVAFEAIHKVTDVLKESVAEAREAQKIGAQTTAVIKSTGGAANVTAKHVHDLAGEIGRATGQNADMIQSNENMLLTFKGVQNQVGKGNDIFDQATQTVTDMSVALGQSGKSSAIQLGKALNDPIKGVTALARVGVTFTQQQKDQIKAMVDSGNTLGAQKLILRELNSEFAGSAKAQSTAGDRLKEAWREVEEEIGAKLLPILDTVETYVADHLPEWMDKGEAAVDKVHDAFERVEPTIAAVINFLKDNPDTVKTFAIVLGLLVAPIILVTGAMAALDAVMAVNPFVLAAIAIAALAAAMKYAYDHSETFHKIVDAAFTGVQLVIQAVWKIVKPIFDLWVLEVKALGAIARWLWNNAFRPALHLILSVLGVLMSVWAKMLGALGHVPGFGWAKDAANTMQDAADAAKHIADNLHNIPSTTNATVVLRVIDGVVHTTGGRVPSDRTSTSRSLNLVAPSDSKSSSTVINLNVTAPVGASAYDIGEELTGYLREYAAAGGL